jgi:hypothetical protein
MVLLQKGRKNWYNLFSHEYESKPMTNYENMRNLLQFFDVHDFPRTHWSNWIGWGMASCMHELVVKKTRDLVQAIRFIFLDTSTIKWTTPNSFVPFKRAQIWNWKLRWHATTTKTLWFNHIFLKYSQFKRCEIWKEFRVFLKFSKFQNFKSSLPHVNGV